jgi:hypothetical protein
VANILEQFVKGSEISQRDCPARVKWIRRDEPEAPVTSMKSFSLIVTGKSELCFPS